MATYATLLCLLRKRKHANLSSRQKSENKDKLSASPLEGNLLLPHQHMPLQSQYLYVSCFCVSVCMVSRRCDNLCERYLNVTTSVLNLQQTTPE